MAPFHEWARTHEPGWTYAAVRVLLTPVALLLYRARGRGLRNVPRDGPVILAPNHFSNMDHFFCGVFLRRQIRFMSKSQFFGGNPAAQLPVPGVRALPGPARPRRRGGVHHRALGARARRVRRDLRRGRPVAHRRARRAAAGRRPAGARVRRAGGAGGDPRLGRGPRLAARPLPADPGQLRGAAALRRGRARRRGSSSSTRRGRSSTACATHVRRARRQAQRCGRRRQAA